MAPVAWPRCVPRSEQTRRRVSGDPEVLTADSCAEVGRHLVLKRFVEVGPWLREATVLRIERDRVLAVTPGAGIGVDAP